MTTYTLCATERKGEMHSILHHMCSPVTISAHAIQHKLNLLSTFKTAILTIIIVIITSVRVLVFLLVDDKVHRENNVDDCLL